MPTVTIYALKDPRDGQIRYVGKTKQEPRKRFQGHLNEKRTTRKCRWFAALKAALLEPIILVLEEVPENEWEASERFWIEYCKLSGFNLTNHTDGGDGVHNPDTETRAKVSAYQKRRFSDPEERNKLSANKERSAKISAALTGKPKSREHVANLPQNQLGYIRKGVKKEKPSKHPLGSGWAKGRVLSVVERQSRSLAQRGQRKPPAHINGIRQGQLSYWGRMTKEERRVELFSRLSNKKENTTK